jgi:hypothetical protein
LIIETASDDDVRLQVVKLTFIFFKDEKNGALQLSISKRESIFFIYHDKLCTCE